MYCVVYADILDGSAEQYPVSSFDEPNCRQEGKQW